MTMTWLPGRRDYTELSERIQWYASIRLIFLLALAAPGIISAFAYEGWGIRVQHDIALAALALSSNLIFYILTRIHHGARYQSYLTVSWIILDILTITALIFINGGIESRAPILYTIPVLVSAAIFGKRAAYGSAMTAALSYVALIIADYHGIIQSSGAFDPSLRTNLPYVLNTIVFFPSIIFLIAAAVDFITSLLFEKQQQLSESVQTLTRAQEIARLGSWEWNIATGDIHWSKQVYDIFGIKPSEQSLSYDKYAKLIHPDDSKAHRKRISQSIKTGVPFQSNHRIITPAGDVRYIHTEGRPIAGDDGTIIGVTGVTQDVTDIYTLDTAKREFVSLASHQLRTPASGVKAFLSLLLEGYGGKLTRKQQDFARKAQDANNRQLEIIENLLNLAAIESGKLTINKELVDIHEIIQKTITSHRHTAREHKQLLRFHRKPRTLQLEADPSAIEMVIDNLISNALKYTPTGGAVTVTTRTTSSSAYIDVTDSGIGIAKKDLPELFHKFNRLNDTASRTVGGSGLGLYLARSITKLHNGSVAVRSRHGEGSTFTVRLPLSRKKR